MEIENFETTEIDYFQVCWTIQLKLGFEKKMFEKDKKKDVTLQSLIMGEKRKDKYRVT